MINQKNIELLYDCLNESASLIYQTYKKPYLEGLVKTCENIKANSVEDDFKIIKPDLLDKINRISDINFNGEEIRKAFQYACLTGFKHKNISNQMITPDTVGIFIAYLIQKLYSKKELSILDPLVGTGNLITTIVNALKKDVAILGVDNNLDSCRLASALFDMLEYGEQVYFQDTMTYIGNLVDLIVADFSGIEEKEVYDIIEHHYINIVQGGFLIGIFDNKTVGDKVLIEHSKNLKSLWNLFGLIKLPNKILKSQVKSIVIFQKTGKLVMLPKSFLLAELPEFTNKIAMKKVINHLNDWFQNTEFFKLEEKQANE